MDKTEGRLVAFTKLYNSENWPIIKEWADAEKIDQYKRAFALESTSPTFTEEHAHYKGRVYMLQSLVKMIEAAPKELENLTNGNARTAREEPKY